MKTTLMMIILSFVVVSGSALAQTDQPQSKSKSRWENPKGAHGLKLTDDQKKDIQKIKFDLMQEQIDLRAKIAHARLDYGRLTSADSPDEDAIAAKLDDISKLQVQVRKNLLDGWFAVNKILPPDQQKIWRRVLQHPRMAARRMMMRMRTNGGNGVNGIMQRRAPRVGQGPINDNGPMLGEGLDNDTGVNGMDYLGPMADLYMFDDESDDLSEGLLPEEMFDEPAPADGIFEMDNMDMMDQNNTMGPGGFTRNRIEVMKRMMNQMPEQQPQDSTK